ncbi:MAG: tripartite tricarboxylate transporter substrate binding protein [Betaproteobacteria bacterium]|nr:tripartite tricarboxylate transporter substrate binding protein [Betaproteobacteria bacterium]
MRQMKKLFFTLIVFFAGFAVNMSFAQPYPSKPIRLVVPFPPGGPTDLLARAIGQKLQERIGQSVIIDNKPGASTIIGVDAVVKSPADGYTLLLGSNSLALNRFLILKMPYDIDRDIAPVILLTKISNALVVHPSLPVKDLKEFISYAKANPGKITYASTGNGTATHLFGEMFASMTGIDMTHVPYKGTAPALNDLLSGQVTSMFDSLTSVIPNVRAGKVRLIGLTNSKRAMFAPEMPTLSELGLPDYEAIGWFGIAAPAKVPAEVINKLNFEINAILQTPEMATKLSQLGGEVAGGSPDDFKLFIQSEAKKWGRVIQNAKIKME